MGKVYRGVCALCVCVCVCVCACMRVCVCACVCVCVGVLCVVVLRLLQYFMGSVLNVGMSVCAMLGLSSVPLCYPLSVYVPTDHDSIQGGFPLRSGPWGYQGTRQVGECLTVCYL